ncbi:MAG: ABC transporter substrate-binding protein, partial [Firmicutes bacterium]|nr:ABC transporter substrate-binding protein [Bacillota bacterium]
MNRQKLAILLSVLLALSLLVTACGKGGQSAGSGGSGGPSSSGAPAAEKTVVVGLNADAAGLDPVLTMDATTIRVLRHIYDPLFFRDKNMKLVPELAESAKYVDDKTWEIKLKKGIKFHNGEPFNAEAVKYTLDFVLDPNNKALTRSLVDRITSVTIVDDYTVKITTKEPFPT